MQLEVSQKFHVSQTQELETLKEALLKVEAANEQFRSQDEEQHRKELSHASEVRFMLSHLTSYSILK